MSSDDIEESVITTKINPYLNFRDTSRQALEFYQSVFGGELTFLTFADVHSSDDPAEQYKIAHGILVTEGGLTLMASDTPNIMKYAPGNSWSISLSGEDEAELRAYWGALSAGGVISAPLAHSPWGDVFGVCADKFGIGWLVNIYATRSEGAG